MTVTPAEIAGPALRVDAEIRQGSFVLELSADVAPGEVLGVLGPNGAGKSTLLRALAGLTAITSGRIVLGETVLDEPAKGIFLPAEHRPVGLVFQNYRLFPHMSVQDNIAFPARVQGRGRQASREVTRPWLHQFDLEHLASRRPSELSGGQRQRVAIARALAARPGLLLLDEPLSALDAQTRLEVRAHLRDYIAEFTGPTLVVTHDPLEAMVLADRLIVIEGGRVVQRGRPADVARRPTTQYVARLVGLNLLKGRLEANGLVKLARGGTFTASPEPGLSSGTQVLVGVRPSSIAIHTEEPHHLSVRNVWPGVVTSLEMLAERVRVQIAGEPAALVDVTAAAVAELRLRPGSRVWLSAKATDAEVYPDPARQAEQRMRE